MKARITPQLSCPRCGRMIHAISIRGGDAWLRCRLDVRDKRGCSARWLNVTLSAGATGEDLLRLVGDTSATRGLVSHLRIGHKLGQPLAPDSVKPVHFQFVCRGRDEHQLRYAPLTRVIASLLTHSTGEPTRSAIDAEASA